jgi:hypothetical protein
MDNYQFNREQITPSFVKCNRTPASRQEVAEQLAAAMANCKIKPTVVPGFTGVAPRPKRSSRVDPETKLKRKKYGIPVGIQRDFEAARREDEEKARIKAMADILEVVA